MLDQRFLGPLLPDPDGPRRCPGAGCTETVSFRTYACRRHWYSLPPEVRARVNGAWRRFSGAAGRGDLEAAKTALAVYERVKREADALLSSPPLL